MPFDFLKTSIPDVVLAEYGSFPDDRGSFAEIYRESEFAASGIPDRFVQDNLSRSTQGVLRGLHYQKNPHAQGKLVFAISGSIFDVAVDLRRGSPTFGRWVGEVLSDENRRMLWVPQGFAHGFCVLSETADVVYKVTSEYAPDADRGVAWNDSTLAIDWPIENPSLSDKDAVQPTLEDADINFEWRPEELKR